jgi:hypothetical protein
MSPGFSLVGVSLNWGAYQYTTRVLTPCDVNYFACIVMRECSVINNLKLLSCFG